MGMANARNSPRNFPVWEMASQVAWSYLRTRPGWRPRSRSGTAGMPALGALPAVFLIVERGGGA